MTYELKACPKPRVRAKRPRAPLRPKKRMKKINAKRGGHAFPKNVDEPYREWIRAQPCVIRGRRYESAAGYLVGGAHECQSVIQACHVKTRGAGGKDRNNTVSMCADLHTLQHTVGIRSFNTRWGVNLKEIAHRLTEIYEAEKFPCP